MDRNEAMVRIFEANMNAAVKLVELNLRLFELEAQMAGLVPRKIEVTR